MHCLPRRCQEVSLAPGAPPGVGPPPPFLEKSPSLVSPNSPARGFPQFPPEGASAQYHRPKNAESGTQPQRGPARGSSPQGNSPPCKAPSRHSRVPPNLPEDGPRLKAVEALHPPCGLAPAPQLATAREFIRCPGGRRIGRKSQAQCPLFPTYARITSGGHHGATKCSLPSISGGPGRFRLENYPNPSKANQSVFPLRILPSEGANPPALPFWSPIPGRSAE